MFMLPESYKSAADPPLAPPSKHSGPSIYVEGRKILNTDLPFKINGGMAPDINPVSGHPTGQLTSALRELPGKKMILLEFALPQGCQFAVRRSGNRVFGYTHGRGKKPGNKIGIVPRGSDD
jgi:hypothetical protein